MEIQQIKKRVSLTMDIQQIKKSVKPLPVEEEEEEELHSYIEENLLTEILIRASARTLARCKCVNKRFNSLISNPHFITRRSSRPLTNIHGLFHFSESAAMIYLLPFYDSSSSSSSSNMDDLPPQRLFANDDNVRKRIILASCNGFLLLHFLNDRKHYYLCNPTTKKCLCIPKFTQKQLPSPMLKNCCSLGLCIIEPEPSLSSQYSHSSNFYSYKLVLVYYDKSHYRFIIFSKETGHWKLSKEKISCTYSQLFCSSNSVYYHGALHWLREKGDDILAFHVQKEQAKMIHIPENMTIRKSADGYQDTWFGVAAQDDLLNIVSVTGNQVVIWVLGDYENIKWQVKRRIETDWIDTRTSLPKYFDGERLVMVEKKIISGENILFDAHIYNVRTGERNTKNLKLWLDNCRVFVPCIDNLIDL